MTGSRLCLCLVVVALGCGGDSTTPDPAPSLTGTWVGAPGPDATIRLDLVEDGGGGVTGSGVYEEIQGTAEVTVTEGHHDHPEVLLAMLLGDSFEADFEGEMEGEDRVVGLVVHRNGHFDLELVRD